MGSQNGPTPAIFSVAPIVGVYGQRRGEVGSVIGGCHFQRGCVFDDIPPGLGFLHFGVVCVPPFDAFRSGFVGGALAPGPEAVGDQMGTRVPKLRSNLHSAVVR